MKTRFPGILVHGLALPAFLCLFAATLHGADKKPPKITFEDDLKPILRQKCFACHNPDKKSGDLDLTNFTALMEGGGSGPVVEPGDAESSYLYMLITHDSEPFMPPESPKLPDDMIETVRKWVDGGALENAGSQAKASNKPKFDLALETTPTERPAEIPMPGRLGLEPAIQTSTSAATTALATSPWAPLLAAAGQQQVLLYNTQTLDLVGVLPFPEGVPEVLKFSRNGALLLAGGGRGGASGRVVVWNTLTGERVFEVGDELDTVLAADISSDQTLIALGGPQRVVRIYSTETGQKIHELRKHTDWIYSLEFSPDSVLLATGDRNGGLHVWEAWTGREYLTLNGHTKGVTGISWRLDSNLLSSCSEDGSIRLWEMENGKQIKTWGAHGGGACCVEYTRDGRLVSCGRDRVAKLWDQNGKQQRAFEAFGDIALETSYCDETNRIFAGDWTGMIRVWNAADGKRQGEIQSNPPALASRLEAAQKQLAAQQAAHKPLAQALGVAEAAVNQLKSQLATAQSAVSQADKTIADAVAKVNALEAALAESKAKRDSAKTESAALDATLKLLKEAAAKGKQAAEKAPGDGELVALAAQMEKVTQSRTAHLANLRAVVTRQESLVGKNTKDLSLAQQTAANAAVTQKTTKSAMNELGPKLKEAEEKLAAARNAADQAVAALEQAKVGVERWKDEIAFAEKLKPAVE